MSALDTGLKLQELRAQRRGLSAEDPRTAAIDAELHELSAELAELLEHPLDELVAEGWRLAPDDDPATVQLCHPQIPRLRRKRSVWSHARSALRNTGD